MRKIVAFLIGAISIVGLVVWLGGIVAVTFFPAARQVVSPVACGDEAELSLTDQYCASTQGGCYKFMCLESGSQPQDVTIFFCVGSWLLLLALIGLGSLSSKVGGGEKRNDAAPGTSENPQADY